MTQVLTIQYKQYYANVLSQCFKVVILYPVRIIEPEYLHSL